MVLTTIATDKSDYRMVDYTNEKFILLNPLKFKVKKSSDIRNNTFF